MTRPHSRLDDEHDRAASHDLEDVQSVLAGHAFRFWSVCGCGWESDTFLSGAEARRAHDGHRDHELGLAGRRSTRPSRWAVQ